MKGPLSQAVIPETTRPGHPCQEQNDADSHVWDDDAEPDVRVERIHERKYTRLLFVGFLDHDADTELHERLAEVDDAFSHWRYRQRSDSQVRLLSYAYQYNIII